MIKFENVGNESIQGFENLGKEADFKSLAESGELKEGEPMDVKQMEHIVSEDLAEQLFSAEERLRKLQEKRRNADQKFEHLLDNDIAFAALEVNALKERMSGVKPLAEKINPEKLDELINSEAYKN